MTAEEVLELVREARQAHTDAGNSDFHEGAVAVCEEIERVLLVGEHE